jgi:hypothetical protein
VFVRAVVGWYRRRARRAGWADGHSGSVTVIQPFGSGLQLNVHGHALVLDGVFTEAADGTLQFHPAAAPTDLEVARLVATIRTRVLRLLRRRGIFTEPADDDAPDPLAETSLALAGITSAAVQGRSALGPRAGARVLQLGRVPGAPWVTSTGTRQAHLDGFDLHANVAVAANNRDGLEQLARYVLRPPIAQERLTRTADGRVLLTLKGAVGVIEVVNPSVAPLGAEDLDFLNALANDVAVAYDKARLYARLGEEVVTLRGLARLVGAGLLGVGALLAGGAVFATLARALPLTTALSRPSLLAGLVVVGLGAVLLRAARGGGKARSTHRVLILRLAPATRFPPPRRSRHGRAARASPGAQR